MLRTKNDLNVENNFCTQHVLPRFELGIFMHWTCNSMNNQSSYCGLVDEKIRASDKDLPVWKRCPISIGYAYIARNESSGKTFSQLWIFWGSYINWNLCNATSQGPLKPSWNYRGKSYVVLYFHGHGCKRNRISSLC